MEYHAVTSNDPLSKVSIPIPSKKVIDFLSNNKITLNSTLFDYNVVARYTEKYKKWIQSSKLNNLRNLNKFKSILYSAGTSESFINFTTKYNKKRFRTFKGEFVFHRLNCRNNNYNFCYIEDEELKENDAVIISLPFTDIGDKHPLMEKIIKECNFKSIPVLIDCAYMVLAKNIEFDFDQPCIDTITFSLSKGFWGIDKLRLGLRFQRQDTDDNLEIYNKWKTLPLHSMAIGELIFNEFDVDWLWNMYGEKYNDVCTQHNLIKTNSICHALGGNEYKDYNRGGSVNRVCVSNSLKDYD